MSNKNNIRIVIKKKSGEIEGGWVMPKGIFNTGNRHVSLSEYEMLPGRYSVLGAIKKLHEMGALKPRERKGEDYGKKQRD
jgi:hypothetical protein